MNEENKQWLDRKGVIHLWNTIKAALDDKVNKVDGLGLSANDFSNAYKEKVDGMSDDPSIIISKLDTGTGEALTDDVQIITQDVDTTQQKYYRRPVATLWEYIKSKAETVFSKLGHTHTLSNITDWGTYIYDATRSRTKRTVLAAPKDADGVANFRALDKNDVGLGNVDNVQQLPKTGGEVGGRITRAGGGSWISDRNNVVAFGTKATKDNYNPVVGQKTPSGAWTMGNLGNNEHLIFNYTTDTAYNSGTNNATQVYLPAQAGTIITSATIGNQTVATAKKVADSNNSSATTFAYSKSGMNYGDYTWLAAWNGYELRAVNKDQFATSGHTHGLNSSSLAMAVSNATTNSWDMVGGNSNNFLLRSLRMQLNAPAFLENNYAAGIVFGGSDTKGTLSVAYNSPAFKIAGGNGSAPVWWMRLTGTRGTTYNLNSMPYAQNAGTWAGLTARWNHNTSDTWIPVKSNNNIDYVLKSEITADKLSLSGGTMKNGATITFADSGTWSAGNGTYPRDCGGLSWTGQSDGVHLYAEETGGDNLDLVIRFTDDNSNGVSIRNAAGNQTARISATGVFSGSFSGNASTATTASKLGRGGATGTPMTFNWSGKSGQPSWLWGGNDGTNMYVYNPSNFSVNYASSAGSANSVAWGNVTGKPSTFTPSTPTATSTGAFSGVTSSGSGYVRFTDGTQFCWGNTNSINDSGTSSHTFPAAFSATPYIALVSTSNLDDVWYVKSRSTTAVSFGKAGWLTGGASYIAAGRWK